MNLAAVQTALRDRGLDAWLFYDHHHRDPIAYRILGLPETQLATRRWFYLIPASGEPSKLAHRIEAGALEALPGESRWYANWHELEAGLRGMLSGARGAASGSAPRVAMQYAPEARLPAISLADAGTVEWVRRLGCEVVSSADLITLLDATWDDAMLASHRAAGAVIDRVIREAFNRLRRHLDARGGLATDLSEYDLQQWMQGQMEAAGLLVDESPIVACNAHAGNPHYEPHAATASPIAAGDLVLLDVWARQNLPRSVYYDVTWVGYCLRPGENAPPEPMTRAFEAARAARDATVAALREKARSGIPVRGFELDRVARAVIEQAGYGPYFLHRTGHSLGREVHASGANLDDFETRDERLLLPRTACTIEPGIYSPGGEPFGVRTEINVFMGDNGPEVTSPSQREIVRI